MTPPEAGAPRAPGAAGGARAPRPPNLLFLFADELRASALGCAGNPDVRTPHLDRLAAGGVRFTDAVANNAVCTPARGSILTGCWPQTHRALANDLPVDPHAPSIARSLDRAGYRCGYAGKWHLGGIPRDRFIPPGPERLGFDAFWAAWNCSHRYLRARYHLNDSPEPVDVSGVYEPRVQTDLAMGFIGARPAGEGPWCLYLSYGPPHEPYRPLPPGYEGAYDPARLRLPPNCPDTPEHRRDLADYYTHVTALDDQVGRLLAFLEQRGELDGTLVVFTSDHGSMLGSHGRQNKHAPWEEATVVPLLMRLPGRLPAGPSPGQPSEQTPGLPAGTTDDLLIGHVDLAPTLLGLLGLPPDPAMEGTDYSAAVTRPASGDPAGPAGPEGASGQGGAARPRSAYLQAVICADQAQRDGLLEWRGVRTHRATYAAGLRGPWLLYDNAADPFQRRNLVDDPAAAGLRQEMQAALDAWMARTRDALEPREAVLARYGLAGAWAERAAHFRAVRRRAG